MKKSIGIDIIQKKIEKARKNIKGKNVSAEFRCEDIQKDDLSDATVILFWFTDEQIINKMFEKFENLNDETKIITIWGPLPDCLPDEVNFPYILNKTPFSKAKTMQEQFWLFWSQMRRFCYCLGICRTIHKVHRKSGNQKRSIFNNYSNISDLDKCKKLDVACGDEIPESIQTYINIMKMHFDIDFEYLLKE